MHPLMEDLKQLKDGELEEKIQSLSKKYYQTFNPSVQHQIVVMLEGYREELEVRRRKVWQEQQENRNKDLDNLINVR